MKIKILFLIILMNAANSSPIMFQMKGQTHGVPKGFYAYFFVASQRKLIKSPISDNYFVIRAELEPYFKDGGFTKGELYFSKRPDLSLQNIRKYGGNGTTLIIEPLVDVDFNFPRKEISIKGVLNNSEEKFKALEIKYAKEVNRKIKENLTSFNKDANIELINMSTRSYYAKKLTFEKLKLVTNLKDKVAFNNLMSIVSVSSHFDWFSYQELNQVFSLFSDAERNSQRGKKINELLKRINLAELKRLKVGDVFPKIMLPGIDGKIVDFNIDPNAVVLIDFWASWCGPCRAEFPYIKLAMKNYKSLKVVAISIDKNKQQWLSAIKSDHTNSFLHLIDNKGFKSDLFHKLNLKAIPTNFLINGKGKIIAINLKNEDFGTFLKKYDNK